MVRYQSSDLNVVDVFLAEFQKSIMHAIPQMFIFLLSGSELDRPVILEVNALLKISSFRLPAIVDVIVAEPILSVIPRLNVLLGDILAKIPRQGKIPTFLFKYHQI